MKKILLSVFAVAALASCIQNETINPKTPIGFGDAYVQNTTKAIYEGETKVESFKVWGTVTPNGATESVALYEGANVTRDSKNYGVAWNCDVTRFWTPDCDYNFYAVVDATTVNATAGVPTSIVYEAVGDKDLLYGATTKSTQGGLAEPDPALVAFTMQHLLSKVSFKFTNTNTNSAYTYKVTNVEVSGAWSKGTYTFADTAAANTSSGTWARTGEGTMAALSFLNGDLTLANATVSDGNITASTATAPKSFVIIPGEPELNIAITVETLLNSAKIYSEDYTLKVNQAGGTDKTFVKNTHYNFVVALEGGKPIDFTIGSVGDFGTGADTTIQ